MAQWSQAALESAAAIKADEARATAAEMAARVETAEALETANRQKSVDVVRAEKEAEETRLAAAESPEEAQEVLKQAIKAIDRAAAKGTMHRKTASRRIARLSRHVFKAQSSDAA